MCCLDTYINRMKAVYFILLISFFATACNSEKTNGRIDASDIETTSNVKEPKFEFKESSWDFGKIKQGERVEHTFKFKNVGNGDLIISSAAASCGCTIPDWPKEPIAPGEEGKIKVEFNSAGKSDMVTKDVTILANTNPVKSVLQIKVFVEVD